MDIKEAIFTRRSIRAYENKPVDPGLVRQMIEAAVQAPCGMGIEPWKFAVIQDREILTDLSGRTKTYMLGMIDQIPPLAQYRETLENPSFNVLYGAPALVLICSVQNSSPTAEIDCALAAQNLMLAARRSRPGHVLDGLHRNVSEDGRSEEAHRPPGRSQGRGGDRSRLAGRRVHDHEEETPGDDLLEIAGRDGRLVRARLAAHLRPRYQKGSLSLEPGLTSSSAWLPPWPGSP